MWEREDLECNKQTTMDASNRSSEAQKTDRNTENKDCDNEVSDGNEDSAEHWTRDH
jgi:hypothetical protein